MRIAHVDMTGTPLPIPDPNPSVTVHLGQAHLDGDVVIGEEHRLDACPRRDLQRLTRVHICMVAEIASQGPDAIAAHLAERAIAIAIVHKPNGLTSGRDSIGVVCRIGAYDADHPVRAYPGPPVADAAYVVGRKLKLASCVGQEHEIVLGAMAFDEWMLAHIGDSPKHRCLLIRPRLIGCVQQPTSTDSEPIMGDTLTLKDGNPGWVWPLLPTHRESLVKAFEDLSPESRRLRFLTPVERLSDSMLHQLVDEVDGVDHIALVVFVETETEALPIAIGRIVRYPDIHDAADIAVTVRDDWQGRGVATALLSLLVARRPVDVTRIITEVAMDNPASLAMLRHLGPMRLHDTGMGIFDVEINLEATAPSVMPEEPVTGERLHPVLGRPGREILRNRDLVCGWLSSPASDTPESPSGPAQSRQDIDPEALDKTI